MTGPIDHPSRMQSLKSAQSFSRLGDEIQHRESNQIVPYDWNYFSSTLDCCKPADSRPPSPILDSNLLEEPENTVKSIDFLSITRLQQETIQNLFQELAFNDVFKLAISALRLSQIGKQLKEEVHPYRFLIEILLTPAFVKDNISSKECLRQIYKDKKSWSRSRIWLDFITGLGTNFTEREAKGEIAPYRKSFADILNVDPNRVLEFESNKAWGDLVIYVAKFDE